jgi:hypothetical protein
MGAGILAAVEVVFPNRPNYICHFHFLRDIGKDLLLKDYQAIMKLLRKWNVRVSLRQKARYLEKKLGEDSQTIIDFIEGLENGELQTDSLERIPTVATYALIQWAFELPWQSRGYGFPFDRPHLEFYQRLKEVHRRLRSIIDIHLRNKAKDNRPFLQVWRFLEKVMGVKALNEAVTSMEAKTEVFDKLRDALRIALPDGKNGLNDDGDETDIKTIEKNVNEFREWLVSNKDREKIYTKMIEQIDKYWNKLFANPIVVKTDEEEFVIVPQRTNNILEQFFHSEKRRERKKSGTIILNKKP